MDEPRATVHAPTAEQVMRGAPELTRHELGAVERTPLAQVIDQQDASLERLALTVERLEDRLGPVLSPSFPVEGDVITAALDRIKQSTVVEHGYRHIGVIDSLSDRLQALLARIEV